MRFGCLPFSLSFLVVIVLAHLPSPALLGAFYALSEIFLAITKRSGAGTVSRDRRSLFLLWAIIGFSIVLAYLALTIRVGKLPCLHFWAFVGLLFFLGGVALRWSSIFYLGRFFTVDVAIADKHELIDTGPYRFIRHPSYTGALLAFAGFGLVLGNWLALLCLVFPITAAFLWRIRVEEHALIAGLGNSYRQYILRTKRLVPFVY
jgi:protein-S-isoprenylcysteine O-methyltransferase